MRNVPGRLALALARALALLALLPGLYLAAAAFGALLPAASDSGRAPGKGERIYLLTTLLHADIAVPLSPQLRQRYAFLQQDGVPVDDPRAKYLLIGWGSRTFYTATERLSDIRPGPLVKAITGDDSVMHLHLAGDVSGLASAYAVDLPPRGIEGLLRFAEKGFRREGSSPVHLRGAEFGPHDAFYAGTGQFDLWHPCNIWTAQALRAAGLSTGRWTPTTRALLLSLRLHSPEAVAANAI